MTSKKKQQRKRISFLLLIPLFLIFIGLLLFKISSLTGDVIRPPCPSGSTLVKFNVNGMMDGAIAGMLGDTRISIDATGRNCVYTGKTNKFGYVEFPRIVPGEYKLIVMQKDINRGKSLCDNYKATLKIDSDSEYSITLRNCNKHAFNIGK